MDRMLTKGEVAKDMTIQDIIFMNNKKQSYILYINPNIV
jgi:hypothetical protein